MTITVDAKPLLEAIKKVIKVTGAKTLNFNFTENKVTISAMLNQHRMELILPIECQEEAKFNIFSDALLPVLENKEKVSLYEMAKKGTGFEKAKTIILGQFQPTQIQEQEILEYI